MTGGRLAIKCAIKSAVKHVLMKTHAPDPSGSSRILTFHSVGYRLNETNVSPKMFREQMAWLSDHYPIISLKEAAAGKPGVAVTLDDGYRDNLLYAAPVLEEFHIPATVFVVAGFMGKVLWEQDDPTTGTLLNPEETGALHRIGVTIGSHSMTHRRLALLSPIEQQQEIRESARILSDIINCPVTQFAYPYGTARDYTASTMQILQIEGFELAVSNQFGSNPQGANPYDLRRIPIDCTDDLDFFRAKVEGRLDLLRVFESQTGLRLRQFLNKVTGA